MTRETVIWVVMKDGEEIIRLGKKWVAEAAAADIGGYVVKYTVV